MILGKGKQRIHEPSSNLSYNLQAFKLRHFVILNV
jgi:hypothetical protein